MVFLSEVRQQRALRLPVASNSAVATALLEEALRGHIEGKELSVKALFASAGYSAIGMRYQFDKLCELRLLKVRRSEADKRRKVVSISEKAVRVYVEILGAVNDEVLSQLFSNEGGREL